MHIAPHCIKNFGYVEVKSRPPCIVIPVVISTVPQNAWGTVLLPQQVFQRVQAVHQRLWSLFLTSPVVIFI